MKRSKLALSCVVAIILIVALLVSSCKAEPEEAKELEIGGMWGLSGFTSESATLTAKGEEWAADWFNDQGGLTINGEKYLIKVVLQDDQGTADGAIAAANRLIYEDNVKFVTGTVLPPLNIAVAPIFTEAKVLHLKNDGSCSSEEINPDIPYTFNTYTPRQAITPVWDFLVKTYPEVKKVAVICPEDSGAIFLRGESAQEAERQGLEVVLEESMPFDSTDFYPVWTKILASGAEGVETGLGTGAWRGLVLKQGRELGFTGPIFSIGFTSPDVTLEVAGKDLATDFFIADVDINSPEMPQIISDFQAFASDKYGLEKMTTDYLDGLEAMYIIVQAIEEAQSIDPTEVMQSWEQMTSIETIYGTGKMGGLETLGVNHVVLRPVPISRIMNGELTFSEWTWGELP